MKPVILHHNATSAYLYLLDHLGRPGAILPIKDFPMVKAFHLISSWVTGRNSYQPPDPEDQAVLGGKWGCEWRIHGKTAFYFSDPKDAVLFKLRWGGRV